MNLENLTTEELQALRTKKVQEQVQLDNEQMSIKILMNSLYGALG